jgi:alkyl sulfatase BDS1-like metallo-beta-lactamase superfamily hydrolase
MNQTMNKTLGSALLITLLALAGCGKNAGVGGTAGEAEVATQKANEAMTQELNLADPQDFEDAKRGFIAAPEGKIMAADGTTVLIDFDAYKFVDGKPPATVNPSLWRHATLNKGVGLYKVRDGVHQLRGFDISNITLIDGKTGWIVVDALTSRESSAAAMAFARKHLGNKPVTALVFTHSHADHFGGALGVVTPQEVAERKIPVIASEGFMEEATSENILVGTAMARRSMYQFGKNLPPGPKGAVDTGLGKNVSYGAIGILEPTQLITKPTQELVLDGVRVVFHNVPGAEAPAEMTFSVPEYKVYGGAENLAQTMHNLLPVRGAKARDALRWSTYMQEALDQLGDAEVYVGQHNWPVWGQARIREFITKNRDVYKYTHDQTVRLANAGHTPREIADLIKLPKSLASYPNTRGYYGDLRHNVKAVYQLYLGAYDGNPANLNPLPPQESAKRYLELLGGPDKAVAAAQAAYDKGDFRWAAELLNHAVFGAPDNKAAKELLARTYDQMGYMSEAATWRNSYLTAALELRNGPPKKGGPLGADRHAEPDADRTLPGGHGRRSERPRSRRQGPQGQPGADRPEDLVRAVDRERGAAFQEGPAGRRRQRHPFADQADLHQDDGRHRRGEGHPAERRPQDRRQQDRPGALLQPDRQGAGHLPDRDQITRRTQSRDPPMEVKLNATADHVFGLLTDPKWLEARSLALGELSAKCSARKSGGVQVTMKRRVHRDMNAIIAKVLNPDSDIEIVEKWSGDGDRRQATYALTIVGKPVTVSADIELEATGKTCVYRITHRGHVKVPLIGGVIEKFVVGETEKGCIDELNYLANYLKKNK